MAIIENNPVDSIKMPSTLGKTSAAQSPGNCQEIYLTLK